VLSAAGLPFWLSEAAGALAAGGSLDRIRNLCQESGNLQGAVFLRKTALKGINEPDTNF
jgi:hypothetical protein